jgi:hypothetical protein
MNFPHLSGVLKLGFTSSFVPISGMTCGPSIFAYLVFGPERASTEGMTRPTKITVWRGPGAKLDVQGEDSKEDT